MSYENMLGLDGAMEKLAAAEAADTGDPGAIPNQRIQREDGETLRAESAGQDAARQGNDKGAGDAAAGKPEGQDPVAQDDQGAEAGEKAGKPAGAAGSQDKPDDSKGSDTTTDKEPAKGSRYARSQERLTKTWDQVNAQKAELAKREQELQQREAAWKAEAQQREQLAAQQQQATSYKPEQYEEAARVKTETASGYEAQADGLEARAQKLEDDGKYPEASKLREQSKALRKRAAYEELSAEQLREHAKEVRQNPPPTQKQFAEKLEAQKKEWTVKAAQDFPELAKQQSPLQQAVVGLLTAMQRQDPALAANPQIIYHATRLAAAELAAARVKPLSVELEKAQARIKELEQASAPSGGGAARTPARGGPMTDAEEADELRRMAYEVGGIR